MCAVPSLSETGDTSNIGSETAEVLLQISRMSPEVALPEYRYLGDAGLDLRSAEDCALEPLERKLISTGLKIAIPSGYAGLVLPRSGSAIKQGLSLVNSPGLIDSQYRGELGIIAINLDAKTPIEIRRGDRIAQLMIVPVATVSLVEVAELEASERGEKGFGSSGIK